MEVVEVARSQPSLTSFSLLNALTFNPCAKTHAQEMNNVNHQSIGKVDRTRINKRIIVD